MIALTDTNKERGRDSVQGTHTSLPRAGVQPTAKTGTATVWPAPSVASQERGAVAGSGARGSGDARPDDDDDDDDDDGDGPAP